MNARYYFQNVSSSLTDYFSTFMRDKVTCKEAVLLSVYDFFLLLIWLTPKWGIPWVAKGVCFCGRRFLDRDFKILRGNLEEMRDLPRGSSAALDFEKRTFYNHVCSALETLKFACNPQSLRVEGVEKLSALLEESRKKGTGCMIVTAHLGSWESMGWFLSKISDENFFALARRPPCRALERFLDQLRARIGTKVLMADRPFLLRDMVKTLKRGGILGVVMDQRPAGGRRATVNFLGRKTDFVCGPAIAAKLAGSPVYAIFCIKKGPMHYELISSEVAPIGHAIVDTDLLTQQMATAIEKAVDRYPDQWTWHYDRWNITEAWA